MEPGLADDRRRIMRAILDRCGTDPLYLRYRIYPAAHAKPDGGGVVSSGGPQEGVSVRFSGALPGAVTGVFKGFGGNFLSPALISLDS